MEGGIWHNFKYHDKDKMPPDHSVVVFKTRRGRYKLMIDWVYRDCHPYLEDHSFVKYQLIESKKK